MDAGHPVFEAIFSRRSIRKYTDEPVDKKEVLAVLEAGRWAPSGLNNQPWRFLVVEADDPRQEALARVTKYGHIVRAAKVLFVVVLEKKAMYNAMKDHQGVGACVQNMLLAAHALGLGAVWLGEIVNDQEKSLAAAGLDSERYELQAVVACGRPDQKGGSTRKPLDELLLEPY